MLLLKDEKKRDLMCKESIRHAKEMTWKKTTQDLMSAINKVT
jgi:hypothetical protein